QKMIETVDPQRLYGIVVDRGSIIDPVYGALAAFKKPTMVGARGIYEAAQPGDLVALDGERHLAVLRPDAAVEAHYRAQKGLKCPRDPQQVTEVLRRFADTIRMSRMHRGFRTPLDLPADDQEFIRALAHKVYRGEAPTPDEDDRMRGLIEAPVPAPEIEEGYP
ncbi:MAG TPA: hypothetical protein VHF22_01975, partial [Planctomycetota bacterium]|nr:hypothetical protein [Planctomycetota bacterium]